MHGAGPAPAATQPQPGYGAAGGAAPAPHPAASAAAAAPGKWHCSSSSNHVLQHLWYSHVVQSCGPPWVTLCEQLYQLQTSCALNSGLWCADSCRCTLLHSACIGLVTRRLPSLSRQPVGGGGGAGLHAAAAGGGLCRRAQRRLPPQAGPLRARIAGVLSQPSVAADLVHPATCCWVHRLQKACADPRGLSRWAMQLGRHERLQVFAMHTHRLRRPGLQVWSFGGVGITMDVATQLIRAQVNTTAPGC